MGKGLVDEQLNALNYERSPRWRRTPEQRLTIGRTTLRRRSRTRRRASRGQWQRSRFSAAGASCPSAGVKHDCGLCQAWLQTLNKINVTGDVEGETINGPTTSGCGCGSEPQRYRWAERESTLRQRGRHADASTGPLALVIA